MKIQFFKARIISGDFCDKIAIVTGSSHGIGKAIALELLKSGIKVILNGRDPAPLQKTTEEFEKMGFSPLKFAGDVSNCSTCEELVRYAVDNFKKIDILINNVGQGFRGRFEGTEPWVLEKIISSNLTSSIHCTRACLSEIKKTKGSIIFISSVAGIHGLPFNSTYSAAKMGLLALAQSLRIELYDTGIHIGIVLAGLTDYDENKRIYTPNGTLVPLTRKSHQTRVQVASKVLDIIRKRNFLVVLTLLGKLTYYLERISPRLIEFIILNSKRRTAAIAS